MQVVNPVFGVSGAAGRLFKRRRERQSHRYLRCRRHEHRASEPPAGRGDQQRLGRRQRAGKNQRARGDDGPHDRAAAAGA